VSRLKEQDRQAVIHPQFWFTGELYSTLMILGWQRLSVLGKAWHDVAYMLRMAWIWEWQVVRYTLQMGSHSRACLYRDLQTVLTIDLVVSVQACLFFQCRRNALD